MARPVLIAGIVAFAFIQLTTSQSQDQNTCQNAYNSIVNNNCITIMMEGKSTEITVYCFGNCRTYYDNFINVCTPGDYKVCDFSDGVPINSW